MVLSCNIFFLDFSIIFFSLKQFSNIVYIGEMLFIDVFIVEIIDESVNFMEIPKQNTKVFQTHPVGIRRTFDVQWMSI